MCVLLFSLSWLVMMMSSDDDVLGGFSSQCGREGRTKGCLGPVMYERSPLKAQRVFCSSLTSFALVNRSSKSGEDNHWVGFGMNSSMQLGELSPALLIAVCASL